MVKQVILKVVALIAIFTNGAVANEFNISSSLNRSKFYQNQTIQLSLSVNGANKDLYKSIVQPDISKDFTIVSTSQSSSFSYTNGVSNRMRQYQFTLIPKSSGIFIIDPFKVTFEGKTYSTRPLRVVVREGNAKQVQSTVPRRQFSQPNRNPSNRSVFLEANISTTNIFIGESVQYNVKLYRRVSLWSSISINQEDIQSVWQNNLDVIPERVVRKYGRRYYELELTKKEIRPLTVGEVIIPPLEARFVVDPFSGQYQLNSEFITLNVSALPEPSPLSFTGAIGEFDIAVVTPNQISTSNTIELKLNIFGKGNLDAIKPPVIQDTVDYRVLSVPGIKKESEYEVQQQFDYVIIPKVSGLITIPGLEFSYFNKSMMSYMTLVSPTFSIDVPEDALEIQVENQEIEKDIKFLQSSTFFVWFNALLNSNRTIIILIGFNIIILLFGLFLKFNNKRGPVSPNLGKEKKLLLRRIKTMNKETSLVEMEQILVKSLQNLTNYHESTLHPREVEETLIQADLSDPLVKSTMKWIKNAQILRYSKDKDIDQNHSNSESLKRILSEIYKELEK